MAQRIEGAGGIPRKAAAPKRATASPAKPFNFNSAVGKPTGTGARNPYASPLQRNTGSPNMGPVRAPGTYVRAPLNKGTGGVGANAYGAVGAYSAGAGGDMMGGAGGGAGGGAPAMSEEDWLAQDAEFNDQRAALEREYQNLVAQLTKQRGDYELDTNNSLRNLGWTDDGWNQTDKMTGYGNAFQNQLGDFASRGMLDSSLYGTAMNDLNRGFDQQRGDIDTALQRFIQGITMDQSQAEATKTQGITAAQRQALARMAASQGL